MSHPNGDKIPESHYEAKMKLRRLDLGYESIHVCQYDCALFQKENANRESCPVCKESMWVTKEGGKKVPYKVLRYFPLKDRLKQLYGSCYTFQQTWQHQRGCSTKDGILQHPIDSKAWK